MFIYLKVVLSKGINIDLVKVIFIIVTYLNIRTLRSIDIIRSRQKIDNN